MKFFKTSFLLLFLAICGGLSPSLASDKAEDRVIKVAALHPILGDLAQRIGGEHVAVVNLLKPNGNLHAFEPSTEDVLQAGKSRLLLASGKQIEPYLPKLADSLPKGIKVVDVGKDIPDVLIDPKNQGASCCEGHDHDHEGGCGHDHEHGEECSHHGSNDPHWWHSMDNIKKAAQVIVRELSAISPRHEKDFIQNGGAIMKECDRLKGWGKRQIMRIPQNDRVIVSGHAAFGHLCKELGFRQIAVQGISREDEGSGQRLAEKLKEIRGLGCKAVFPEFQASPKVLSEIAKTLGMKTAKPLVSDGTAPQAHTFDKMYEYNINTIVEALAPAGKPSSDKN